MPVANLFSAAERMPVPISSIALESDITIFGTHYGDTTYYGDYAGIARKYPTDAILEIGVRFGYSGVALCLGALAGLQDLSAVVHYTGMDAEFFGVKNEQTTPPVDSEFRKRKRVEAAPGVIKSHTLARKNFKAIFSPGSVKAEFISINTQLTPFPESVTSRTYGLINVDGDHSYEGATSDMRNCWPLLRPGGLMLVDDMSFTHIHPSVMAFIRELEGRGEKITYQLHHNERDMMIIRKGTS